MGRCNTAMGRRNHERAIAKAKRDKDLARIAEMRLNGKTNDEIAEAVGMSRRWVERRQSMLSELWRESYLGKTDRMAAEVIAKRLHIYSEAMGAWVASQGEEEKTTTKRRKGDKGGFEEAQVEKRKTVGDPRFLMVADKQLDGIAKLLGLERLQVEHTVSADGPASLFELIQQARERPLIVVDADSMPVPEKPVDAAALIASRQPDMSPPLLPGATKLPEPTVGPMVTGNGYWAHKKHRKKEEDDDGSP